jgi:hypothetical protein
VVSACGAKTDLWVDEAGPGTAAGCIELPPEGPPEDLSVSFLVRMRSAEVLLLIDRTGSMTEEIDEIRAALRDSIAPAMVDTIPEVRLSVATFADFPVTPYGDPGDLPFELRQQSTTALSAVQAALDSILLGSGADTPESQVEALFQTATGLGFPPWVPPSSCAAGTVGAPCFRSEGSRIVLLFTDAPFHNGPSGSIPYEPGAMPIRPASYAEAVAALNGIGAHVLGIWSGEDWGREDMDAIARDTGAVTATGAPIVYDIGMTGEALDTGVIESVRTLAEETPIDIDLLLEDGPGDDYDATRFVAAIEAVRADPADGAVVLADRFQDVRPGTTVWFRLVLLNDEIPTAAETRRYRLTVVVRGGGVTRLQETQVEIVVPGLDGGGC